jgi:hypothetical protein
MIEQLQEPVRRRMPRRAPVGAGLIVASALSAPALAGCGAPVAQADETLAAEGALSIWAAAAREYRERGEGWPSAPADLDAVLLRTPSTDAVDVRVLRVDPMDDGSLAMAFAADRHGDDGKRGPLIRGSVIVNPVEAGERPAAVIHWSSGNWIRSASGRTTLQSCALGEYERPAPDLRPSEEPSASPASEPPTPERTR